MMILVGGGAEFIGSNFIFYIIHTYPDDWFVCLDSLTYAGNFFMPIPVLDYWNFRFVKDSLKKALLPEDTLYREFPKNLVWIIWLSLITAAIIRAGSRQTD